jgi:hypothetical protein
MNDDTVPDGGMAMGFDGGRTPSKGLKTLFFGFTLLLSLCMAVGAEKVVVNTEDVGAGEVLGEKESLSGEAIVHNVRWSYSVSNGMAIVGVENKNAKRNVVVPSEIEGYPVVGIKNGGFKGCDYVTKVVIPRSVVSIGRRAFHECGRLECVTMRCDKVSIGEDAFYGCPELSEVSISGRVERIEGRAFSKCTKLAKVTMLNGVDKIMTRAFQGCESLEDISLPDGLESIGTYAFSKCASLRSVTIPGSVNAIGTSAFLNCTSLESVTISDGVEEIRSDAFQGCISLKSLSIPGSVTDISDNAFYRCYSLGSVVIPDGVVDIGDEAFSDCVSLMEITIPQSVTSIGSKAFSGCVRLSGFKVSGENPAFSVRNGILCNKAGTDVLVCPEPSTAVVIPEGVVGIMDYAFGESNSLGRVFLPHSVTNISSTAFYECDALAEVYLSETYTGPTNVFPATAEIIRYSLSPMAISEDGEEGMSMTSVPSFRTLIEGSADMRLAENITTEEDFSSFLSWVGRLSTPKLSSVQVSPFAWLSYAMDSAELATAAPTDGDVRIVGFVPVGDGHTFDMSVSVAGMAVGNAATAANLSTLFTVEGAPAPNAELFSTSGIDAEFCSPSDGNVMIRAAPTDKAANSFFFRVKMK